uniref:TNase-like domain-containing protein n=1 Tax=Macrostomum lignano TaxID=282301 RepID=A0A1I8H604_9PLAT
VKEKHGILSVLICSRAAADYIHRQHCGCFNWAEDFLAPSQRPAKYLCGRVKSVHDGDSLRIIPETNDDGDRASVRVRLMQIDAPELSQAHGRDSRKALASRLPRGTRVCVISPGRDSYHRILGFVCLAKDDIAYRMLAEGHAWCYHNTCNLRYKAATSAARVAGLGLWTPGQTPMAPWAYRRFQRRRARKHRQQGKKE